MRTTSIITAACATLLAIGFASSGIRAEEAAPKPLDVLVQTLGKIDNPAVQATILRGMNTSLLGRHAPSVPNGWPELYEKLKASPNETVRQQAQALSAAFGGSAALEELRKKVADATAANDARSSALDSLLSARDAETLPVLLQLTKQPGPLRAAALRGLANYDDPRISAAIIDSYKTYDSSEKRDGLNTLLGRPAGAHALLAAIDAKTLDRSVITAPVARQLQNFHDAGVDAWMTKNWGAMRTSPADKLKEIARLKKSLDTYSVLHADASRGRAIFTQTCAICHTLFGYGAKIGPELPGSFEDVDYLLLNIVDPNAIIGKDYQQIFIETKDGRTVSGIIATDDNAAVTLKTLAGPVTIQHADIKSQEVSPNSLMPEGLLSAMDEGTVRDLFLYLRQKGQVPMLATQANTADFFNGNDLSRWVGTWDHSRPFYQATQPVANLSNATLDVKASAGDLSRVLGKGTISTTLDASAPSEDTSLVQHGNGTLFITWEAGKGEIIGHSDGRTASSLVSEMIAGDYKLSAMIKVTGTDPVVEFAFRGRSDVSPFVGESLSFGGHSLANLWSYTRDSKPVRSGVLGAAIEPGRWTKCVITSKAGKVSIGLDYGTWFFDALPQHPERNGFALYLKGPGSELHIKDLKLETDTK